MAARSKRKRVAVEAESYEASSTVVGPAFTMPDVQSMNLADEAPIDFEARQDKISPTRRSAGPKLAPKLKRTTAKPSSAKETPVKI